MPKKGKNGKHGSRTEIQIYEANPSKQNFDIIIKENVHGKRTIYYNPKPKTTQYETSIAQMLMQSAQEAAMAFQMNLQMIQQADDYHILNKQKKAQKNIQTKT
ncbi:MAG: hypothetical protein EZS28_021296 [Streblomastix strix]|uniref:Uncharacterized protein n=1 Tax=Streblomastix strix TaxID=222440 RepID=A0A5J4VLF5_9EUKA|nr:MAG: hypothetical protein EZS28_021296 [Streblomastix strix]